MANYIADPLYSSLQRCILLQSQVCARLIVVGRVSGKDAPQMSLAKDHQVIQAFVAKRADQSFCNAILPWRSRSDRPVADPPWLDSSAEDMSIGPVIVTRQVSRERRSMETLR